SVLFSDNFNDNNFNDWVVERNSQWGNSTQKCQNNGHDAEWEIQDQKLGISINNSPPCVTEIIPTTFKLPNTNYFEYSFDWFFSGSTSMDRNVIFNWVDTNNWYDLKIFEDSIVIQKVVDGESVYLPSSSGNYAFSPNNTYNFTIKVSDGLINVKVNGDEVILLEDSSPFSNGETTIGLQASVGSSNSSESYFDNIIVKSVDADLPVPLFKQTDPTWGNEEYGLRTTSSPDFASIAELGCAMTSAAMIMNYHGITQMPDGSPVNPSTLNTWLKGNNGYAGKYIIFPVIGRLTQQISSVYGTPKLEYNRVGGSSWDPARDQITAHNPAVMQVQGHFLVAKGNRDSGDLGINDPFYSFETLMPHTALPVISTRTFTPSYTDLSAISVHAYAPATIQLFKDGELDDQAQNYSEALLNQTTGEEETSMSVIEHMKPPSGEYAVAATTSEGLTPVELYITTMTVDGQTVQEVIEGYTNPEGELLLSFSFDSSQPSEIKRASSWSSLTNDLSVLYDQDKIQKKSIVRGLSHYITAVSTMSLSKQLQHAPIIRYIINHFSDQIDPTALLYLNQELDAIANNLE
ncbi:C39 family peptidase, partial [Candidatus Woesebacteria bacterium]|nr:C39 family peptidase [Candidatus Woesebacteria bacterium]